MKNTILYIGMISLLVLSSCKKYEDEGFQDSATAEEILLDPTLNDLILLTRGIEAQAKVDIALYVDILGALGRETYDLNAQDPRFTGELLGIEGGSLDPGGFITTRSYAARSKNVLQANNVLLGLDNTTFNLSPEQINGFKGFVNTMKANALQMNLNMQYDNGVRFDIADIDNLGPFLDRQNSQQAILDLLDLARDQLLLAGNAFPYQLGSGFGNVSTPSEFIKFNRALAARVALYQGNNSLALSLLSESFLDLNASLDLGAYLSYNTADGVNNPLYHTDKYMAHPTFISDATLLDSRLSKAQLRLDEDGQPEGVTTDGLSSDYIANIYNGPGDNVSIIRNEELILIFAEASVVSNSIDAISAINIVRNAAGIGNYLGSGQEADLMDEIAYQRRYSLFGEAQRWIDMRRWDRLNELPLDRTGDVVHVQFPRPFGE